jgi:hypothetical protein
MWNMGRVLKSGWLAGIAAALLAGASARAAIILDNFVGPQTAFVPSGGSNPSSVPVGATAPGAIGGARLLTATRTSGSGIVYADVNGGLLSHGSGPADAGIATVSYDGNNDTTFDPSTGLGGIDLTGGGTNNGLKFQYRADFGGAVVSVTLYSGASNFSTGSFVAGATGFDPNPYAAGNILFSSMVTGGGTGANPASVTGIKLTIDGSSVPALDLQLQSVVSDVVPEPASLGLMLVGASLLARRRK